MSENGLKAVLFHIEEVGIYPLAVAAVPDIIALVAQQRIGVLGLGSYNKLAPVVKIAINIALINNEAELQRQRSRVVLVCLNSYLPGKLRLISILEYSFALTLKFSFKYVLS